MKKEQGKLYSAYKTVCLEIKKNVELWKKTGLRLGSCHALEHLKFQFSLFAFYLLGSGYCLTIGNTSN